MAANLDQFNVPVRRVAAEMTNEEYFTAINGSDADSKRIAEQVVARIDSVPARTPDGDDL